VRSSFPVELAITGQDVSNERYGLDLILILTEEINGENGNMACCAIFSCGRTKLIPGQVRIDEGRVLCSPRGIPPLDTVCAQAVITASGRKGERA
jgi:hypothetical protein